MCQFHSSIAAPTFKASDDLYRKQSPEQQCTRILLEPQRPHLQIGLQLSNALSVGRCGCHRSNVRPEQKPFRRHCVPPGPAGHRVAGDQAISRWSGLRLVGTASVPAPRGWDIDARSGFPGRSRFEYRFQPGIAAIPPTAGWFQSRNTSTPSSGCTPPPSRGLISTRPGSNF
jgi:hypothetical protein